MKRFCSLLMAVLLMCAMILPMTAAVAEEPVTLTILWWGSQTRHDLTTQMVEKFMEKYPNIKLEMEFTDWGGYWSKLSAQVAGGLTPDIFQMDYAYLSQYAQNGVLASLDDYIASGDLDVSDVAENVLASGRIGGKTYALSTGTNAPVMLYRKDLVREAGVEIPLDPTLSEYIAVSKAVYEKTGMRDTYIVGGNADNLRFMLRNYGMNLYNEDASALGFDDPKYVVDMWNTILTAQAEGYGMLPGEETAATAFNSLVTDTWSRYQNSNEFQAYIDATGAELGMFAIPDMDDATASATYLKPSMFWCVSEQSAKKDAAIKFLNFFTNDPDCFDIVGIDRAIPVSAKMRAHVSLSLNEVSQQTADMVDYFSQPGNASPLMNADPAVHQQVAELLSQYSEQVRYEMVDDLQAAAEAFMAEANQILSSAKAAE